MKLKLLAFSIIFGALGLLISDNKVLAHEIATDGSIQTTLHTEPDDKIVAGKPSEFDLFIKDAANKFDAKKCSCHIIIKQGVTPLTSLTLKAVDQLETMVGYTFQSPGQYQVQITGDPSGGGDFQPFNVSYDLSAQANPNAPKPAKTNYGVMVLFLTILAVGIVLYVSRAASRS